MDGHTGMEKDPTTLEAEVLEIDGIAPAPKPEAPRQSKGDWQDWRTWQGRVRTLDSRWWPLWLILGLIALTLLLTVGLVIGVLFLCIRITLGILRGIFSLFAPPSSGMTR